MMMIILLERMTFKMGQKILELQSKVKALQKNRQNQGQNESIKQLTDIVVGMSEVLFAKLQEEIIPDETITEPTEESGGQ